MKELIINKMENKTTKTIVKNYGFVRPKIQPEEWVVGGLGQFSGEIIQANGQWIDYLPVFEKQHTEDYDTFGCSVFGNLNVCEILAKRLFNTNHNWSDRFLYILTEIKPPGANPHNSLENLRKFGCVNDEELPMSKAKTLGEYNQPSPLPRDLINKASEQFPYELQHDWVLRNSETKNERIEILKDNLKYSPLGVSVYAWQREGDLYVKPEGVTDTHWVALIGYQENQFWIIFDSYDLSIKHLAWDYTFGYAKRISLIKGLTISKKINIFSKILELLKKILSLQWLIDEEVKKRPVEPIIDSIPIEELPKYKWGTKEEVRHSIRVLCDEEKLNVAEKNLICQTINCESGYNPKATHRNRNGTTDWGLCMFNDGKNAQGVPYWIGEGADFASGQECLDNPEKSVRVMLREYKKGNLKYWVCFKNRNYLNFTA